MSLHLEFAQRVNFVKMPLHLVLIKKDMQYIGDERSIPDTCFVPNPEKLPLSALPEISLQTVDHQLFIFSHHT